VAVVMRLESMSSVSHGPFDRLAINPVAVTCTRQYGRLATLVLSNKPTPVINLQEKKSISEF
jgi:hypothetical protein